MQLNGMEYALQVITIRNANNYSTVMYVTFVNEHNHGNQKAEIVISLSIHKMNSHGLKLYVTKIKLPSP
jgi:hypothetical protein